MNNLKQIRELYGATQEQIAQAINVNRVTVANWENGTSVASSSNQEKLSIYYGIGPEYFYEKELDEVAKKIVTDTSTRAQELTQNSQGKRVKEQDFHKIFESVTFKQAMAQYMFSMKMLLATADSGELDKLKTAAFYRMVTLEETAGAPGLRTDSLRGQPPDGLCVPGAQAYALADGGAQRGLRPAKAGEEGKCRTDSGDHPHRGA